MNNNVCSVTVTYHPCEEDIANLAFVREQVQFSVVVDNGSSEIELTLLRNACKKLNVTLIENSTNLGIAAALNIGIRWAHNQACQWVALFDQDSKPQPFLIKNLMQALLNHSQGQKIAIMVPSYVDARSMTPQGAVRTRAGNLVVSQTSGTLMPIAVFEKEGWFDESFFIDCVDYDYCLKIKNHGWIIEECKDAVLLHKPASLKIYKLFGRKLFRTTNYSSIRRYYRTRNIIWMFRRYSKKHFIFCVFLNLSNLKDLIKIIAENNRWGKWSAALRGCIDGIFTSLNAMQ